MPIYIYGCPEDKEHPRQEVTHKIDEDPVIKCEVCGSVMQRVPQSMRFYVSAAEILYDWSEENIGRYKQRKRGYKSPRFSPDEINRPVPIKGRDFEHRRAKENAEQAK